MTSFSEKLHALGTVFDLVGEYEYVDAVAEITMAYEASGNKETAAVRDCSREIDLACNRTADLLQSAKTGMTLLDVVSPYWRDLVILWGHKSQRLHTIWDPVIATMLRAFGVVTANAEYVIVQEDPAAPEFVAVLHMLSEKSPDLRLMFIEADEPDTVWVGNVSNEAALDAMLAPYRCSNWRGNEVLTPEEEGGFVVTEFRVYTLGGSKVFRTHGYVCACDKSAIEVLKTGIMLPHVATAKTASLIRMTFSLQAMTDPHFRDFLRSLGGAPASKVSWDVPIHTQSDIEDTLRKVENGFEYPVQIYQVIDTPAENIFAHTNPDGQAVKILSGIRKATRTGIAEHIRLDDIRDHVAAMLPETEGESRHVLERVLGAASVAAHVVVLRQGEFENSSVPDMFAARTDAEPVGVILMTGGRYPALVTEAALCSDN